MWGVGGGRECGGVVKSVIFLNKPTIFVDIKYLFNCNFNCFFFILLFYLFFFFPMVVNSILYVSLFISSLVFLYVSLFISSLVFLYVSLFISFLVFLYLSLFISSLVFLYVSFGIITINPPFEGGRGVGLLSQRVNRYNLNEEKDRLSQTHNRNHEQVKILSVV